MLQRQRDGIEQVTDVFAFDANPSICLSLELHLKIWNLVPHVRMRACLGSKIEQAAEQDFHMGVAGFPRRYRLLIFV